MAVFFSGFATINSQMKSANISEKQKNPQIAKQIETFGFLSSNSYKNPTVYFNQNIITIIVKTNHSNLPLDIYQK